MKRPHFIGIYLLALAFLTCGALPQAFADQSSKGGSSSGGGNPPSQGAELTDEGEGDVEFEKEGEEEILATLPNTFNPSIHHRRPARKLTKHFGFGVYSDIFSLYVWRGLKSSRGAVWQPSFSLEYYGVGFNVWANFPLTQQPNQGQFNEVDFTLYFHRTFKKINFHTWVYAVVHPNNNLLSLDAGTHSLEWDLHISRPLGPIILFTDVFVRLITAPGSVYWDVGVGHRRDLPLNFALETSGMFALANGRFTKAHIAPGLGTVPYLFEFSLAFPWNPVGGFTVSPKMFVSTMLTSSLHQAAANPTLIWGGVSLSYELGTLP